MVNEFNSDILRDLLPLYYKRLFPHKLFAKWLSYCKSEKSIFVNREISFTLVDDIYIRYLSYENEADLEKDICYRNPFKIDIGAVMSVRPRTQISLVPVQKELVFDIDMTDYDEVRTCCNGVTVCQKCWKYMMVACRILDTALREDFGFENILWVFSGRRGIHCWVCDKTARHLDVKSRDSVAEYLQVGSDFKIFGDKMHHSTRRALKQIELIFEEIVLTDQNLFGNPKGVSFLIQSVPDENIRKDLEIQFKKHQGDSKAIWDTFVRYFSSLRGSGNLPRKFKNIVEEVQLKIAYPKLDINVTKGFNHLLKAPFCVHPGTGKICVPFNPNAGEKFDLLAVPTISTLCEEINKFDDKNNDPTYSKRIKDYKKTGMFKGVVIFEEFLRKLETTILKSEKNKLNDNLSF